MHNYRQISAAAAAADPKDKPRALAYPFSSLGAQTNVQTRQDPFFPPFHLPPCVTHIVTPWLARVRPPESGASAQQAFPTPWVWGEMDRGFIHHRNRDRGGSCGGPEPGPGPGLARSMVGGKGGALAMISRGFGSMWDVDVEV